MLNLTNLQTKGYDELIEIDGEVIYQVFAIKKSNEIYITYYYTVPKNKLDQAEDYEIEEFIRLAEAKESAEIHNQYSILELKVMDEARKQMGIVFPADQ